MRISTKGVRNPKTASIPTYRKEGMTITKIAEKLGVTRQWVDFVLKRDGDPLDGDKMKPNCDYGKEYRDKYKNKKLSTGSHIDTEIE
jgi:predicted transcriptional regulator